MSGPASGSRWWDGAVGYEVYLRSFSDADGDGVGDLRGIVAHLDHLVALGVDALWVTPCYPSPMRDHGYDVADYRAIAPEFGTLDDLDALVAAAHGRGLRVLLDLVPNHSSSDHPWFRAARSSREDPHRDFYIWRDPAPDGGPPNNWVSVFGGRAWTFDETTGQWWLHLFLPDQPDLNWANPAVAEAFDGILAFWFDRGVDGFRIDVAHALVKHPDLPDQPAAVVDDETDLGTTADSWAGMAHVYDQDQPGVLDVHRRWRQVADAHGALLVGEVYLMDPERLHRYVADDDGVHLAFWFSPLHHAWDVEVLRRLLGDGVALAESVRGGLAWVQGSHDRPRVASRYGGGDVGRARQLAVLALQLFLPGMPFVYQGEELGLEDVPVAAADVADPLALRTGDPKRSRDVCRSPMPWSPEPGFGFTAPGVRPWLPFGDRTPADTAAVQADDPSSVLSAYRRLLAARRAVGDLGRAPVEWLIDAGPVLAYRRGAVIVVANGGDAQVQHAVGAGCEHVAGTATAPELRDGVVTLAPGEAVVLTRRPT